MKSLKALLVNLKTYYLMTFRNTFLVIAHYLLPVLFYLMFSVVFVGINEENKKTIIMSMTAFGLAMNSYIGLPGSVVRYAIGDIKRAYIAGGIKLWHVFVCAAISNMVHCFVTSMVILFTAKPLFGAVMPESMDWYFLALFISIVLSTLMGVVIGMFSKTEGVATIISQATFLPSLFLSGTMVPIEFLPKILQTISDLIPLKHTYVLLQGYDQRSLIFSLGFIAALLVLLVIRYRFIIRRE